jgi:hypothetical protein
VYRTLPLAQPLDLCRGLARIGSFGQQLPLVYSLFIQNTEFWNKHSSPNIRHKRKNAKQRVTCYKAGLQCRPVSSQKTSLAWTMGVSGRLGSALKNCTRSHFSKNIVAHDNQNPNSRPKEKMLRKGEFLQDQALLDARQGEHQRRAHNAIRSAI